MNRHRNTQLFALPTPPPEQLELPGGRYRLGRVFKHDFFAATCLYESCSHAELSKVVVKFGRTQGFCGLPMAWLASFLRGREEAIYSALRGVAGVPRWAGSIGRGIYAIEYVEGRPLDHPPPPPEGFFDALRDLFDEVHRRGVAYGDANKRSNILIDLQGRPHLIDYQLAIRRRDDWPWPVRSLVALAVDYLARKDLYHLYKHKRRISPGELTEHEDALSRRRSGLHRLHRAIGKPYRALRRRFLRAQQSQGRLQSPTANLEDHHQPEKDTWRGQ